METKTFYSRNDEEYRASDPQEILDELWDEGELTVGAKYYACDFAPLTMLACIDANRLLENAGDAAYDLVGEAMECNNPFDGVTDEAAQELNELLDAWAKKHMKLDGFCVAAGNSKELFVTASEVAGYAA